MSENDKITEHKDFTALFHEYLSSIQYERVKELREAELFHIFTAGWMAATEYHLDRMEQNR